ncbi:MAG: undecaprenyl-diphosphate phosphatase, partial [Limisphaerales bacterium]
MADLPEWLIIVILGIVEGITEFLPISSTGHLLLTQQLGENWRQSDVFNIVIQSGAVVAVLFVFKQRSIELLTQWQKPEVKDYLTKMFVAFCITA